MKSPLHILFNQLQSVSSRLSPYLTSIALILAMTGLSSCKNVNPSFGYAFAGTWVLLAIAFFIATSVTKKTDHHHHGKKDDKKH
jgi:O-antigen ligase